MLTSQGGQSVFKRVLTTRNVSKEGWFGTKHPLGVAGVFYYVVVDDCIMWMFILGGIIRLIMILS